MIKKSSDQKAWDHQKNVYCPPQRAPGFSHNFLWFHPGWLGRERDWQLLIACFDIIHVDFRRGNHSSAQGLMTYPSTLHGLVKLLSKEQWLVCGTRHNCREAFLDVTFHLQVQNFVYVMLTVLGILPKHSAKMGVASGGKLVLSTSTPVPFLLSPASCNALACESAKSSLRPRSSDRSPLTRESKAF